LPFRDEVFDATMSFTVLEHSPNPLNFLREQFRVLRKGGSIHLTTDNAQYFVWSILSPRVGGRFHDKINWDHYMIFFPGNVRELLRRAGFTVTRTRFLEKCNSRLAIIADILVKIGVWRKTCLYSRFSVEGEKS
jgi:ubiquinone/menaquinone biosynthesis C-methylase UbiE